jgi:hypothetical protein
MVLDLKKTQKKKEESEILAGLAKLPKNGIVSKLTDKDREEIDRTRKAESQPIGSSFMIGILTE